LTGAEHDLDPEHDALRGAPMSGYLGQLTPVGVAQ